MMTTDFPHVLIISGDASGEQHGAKVAEALKRRYPNIVLEGVGGPAMAAAGVTLLADQTRMGQVGAGSLFSAPYHWWLGRKLLHHIAKNPPTVALHIDYGVFNLWLAKQFRQRGIPTVDYIPPQIWASRPGRIRKIKAAMDHVCCIFPFEVPIYENAGVPVTYVGHPLAGVLPPPADRATFCHQYDLNPDQPILAVFPGSRRTEIHYLLDTLVAGVAELNQSRQMQGLAPVQPVLAQSNSLSVAWFEQQFQQACRKAGVDLASWRRISAENRYALQSVADVVLSKSGTTTLETALYGTPMVIVYRLHPIVAAIGFKIALLPCIGLPNILTDPRNPPIPELLQNDCTPECIAATLMPLFDAASLEYQMQKAAFTNIQQVMPTSDAADNVATVLSQWLNKVD